MQGTEGFQGTRPIRAAQAMACLLVLAQIAPHSPFGSLAQAQEAVEPQQASPVQYRYDAQGNLTQVISPDATTTDLQADRLNQTIKVTQPAPAQGEARPVIDYTYDGLGRLLSVKNPKGALTTFAYRGLADTVQVSPDTNTTSFYGRADGSLSRQKNASQGSSVIASSDQLSRPTRINFLSGSFLIGYVLLTYDEFVDTAGEQNNHGRGQLTRVEQYDHAGVLMDANSLRYDQHGRLIARCQFIAGIGSGSVSSCPNSSAVRYAWGAPGGTSAGKLQTVRYPSGREVRYQFDEVGRISGVTLAASISDATGQAVVSGAAYTPLGIAPSEHAVAMWKYGALSASPDLRAYRAYGNAGWPEMFTIGYGVPGWSVSRAMHTITNDSQGRIQSISSYRGTAVAANYSYDQLGRLTQASLPGGAVYGYAYDSNGNRTLSTSAALSTAYSYAGSSNRLSSVKKGSGALQTLSTDSAGNIYSDPNADVGAVTYSYLSRGTMPYQKLVGSTGPGGDWLYTHNFFGERIRKQGFSYSTDAVTTISPQAYVGSTDTVFYYDLSGHLIAEHDASSGQVKREYIWMGDIPVGVVAGTQPNQPISASNVAKLYYVFSDHLNTPRMVTDTAGVRRWQADILAAEPFGASPPNETPAGQTTDQAFALNLRFPGQYLDKETGSFYNYFRTYNPSTGRYLQSDPIGLEGGLNTYAYVEGNPLSFADPTGELPSAVGGALIGAGMDIAVQLLANGGRPQCIKWDVVAVAALAGAVNPFSGLTAANSALKAERQWARAESLRQGSRAAKRTAQRGDKHNKRSWIEGASWAGIEGGAELVGNLIPDERHVRIGDQCECQ